MSVAPAERLDGGMTHRDGEDFRKLVLSSGNGTQRGEIRIDVRADNPDKRSFCWAASTRRKRVAP